MRRSRLALILVALLLGLASVAAAATLPRLPALRCLLAFQESVPADVTWADPPPAGFELLTRPGPHGDDRAWLVRGGPALLVFVHGVAAEGIRDGRILLAIRAFARAGFTVLAPEMPTLVDPLHLGEPGAGLTRWLAALDGRELVGVDNERMGVVAISVGGGLALRGCARHLASGGKGPQAILLIGAPDDLGRTSQEWFAAPDPAAVGDGSLAWERQSAAAFARSFLLRAGLRSRLGDDTSLPALAAWLALDPLPAEPLPPDLSAAATAVAMYLRAAPDTRAAGRAEVLRAAATRTESLSPAAFDGELSALRGVAIFLLHGHGDPLVPLSEARQLARRLRRHTVVDVLESRMVGHTTVESVGLAEQLAHVLQMDDFFAMIGR
ncbi:MAG: hypothetical protein O2894_09175 [Planctomycetota bacterium]|nr:hypothetical protein [Planctomycetota bacterium]